MLQGEGANQIRQQEASESPVPISVLENSDWFCVPLVLQQPPWTRSELAADAPRPVLGGRTRCPKGCKLNAFRLWKYSI